MADGAALRAGETKPANFAQSVGKIEILPGVVAGCKVFGAGGAGESVHLPPAGKRRKINVRQCANSLVTLSITAGDGGVEMILRDMTTTECGDVLSANYIGHLGCISNNLPYVVPIIYVFRDRAFYSFSLPGKKIDSLRANPHACVQVEQVASPEEWQSVLVEGLYEELPDNEIQEGQHMHAWSLLQQRANWWEPGAYKPSDMAVSHFEEIFPVYYRIQIHTISGRCARWE